MNRLEEIISREQKYIMKHGDANDRSSDKQWEQYKEDAERNLAKWDQLKMMRNQMKAA